MIKVIDIEKTLSMDNIQLIDVRSTKEYEVDTIPTAINIPILTDQEREHVGYLYKQVNKEEAKETGLEYASKKLTMFYRETKKITDSKKKIVLFCYRGGMRSNSIARVLDTMGLNVFVLEGGYKSYRKYVNENLEQYNDRIKFVVLHGYTGVGKTKILKILDKENLSVLDIEGLAKNSGSVFGSLVFKGESSSQKTFESLMLQNFKDLKSDIVFTESESKRVGRVVLPDFLYDNMQNGYHILIKTNIKNRIENIKEDYVDTDIPDKNNGLIKAIEKLRKRLSNDSVDRLIKQVNENNYEPVIETLMTDYYDPLYDYSINKVENFDMIIEYNHVNDVIEKLIEFTNKHSLK